MVAASEKLNRWELGCETDPVRNGFLIPSIIKILNERGAANALDVGSSTGYVSRQIGLGARADLEWTLLDRDEASIAFARKKWPHESLNGSFVASELGDFCPDEQFDAVLLIFTLLEIEERQAFFSKLRTLVSSRGCVILAVPDCLQDLISKSESQGDIGVLKNFLDGVVRLSKIDKFTGAPYPFFAQRNEQLISMSVEAGFKLSHLIRQPVEGSAVYLMVFETEHLT